MPSTSKLGRNPLEKLKNSDTHTARVLPPPQKEQRQSPMAVLEKIREMQIQVDWPEVYGNTVAFGVRKLSRLLKVR